MRNKGYQAGWNKIFPPVLLAFLVRHSSKGVIKVLHLETKLVVCLKEPLSLLIGLAENIFLRGELE